MDVGAKFFYLRLLSPSGNGAYGLVISPNQISFIKTPSVSSMSIRAVPTFMMVLGMLLKGFPGLIIGGGIGWAGYYFYKKNYQRGFERRMEGIIQTPDKYEKTDDLERLTLGEI